MDLKTALDIGSHLVKIRKKALYPLFPFLSVPMFVIWLIVIQFQGVLASSPGGGVSALHLQSYFSPDGTVAEGSGTILVVPFASKRLFLPTVNGRIQRIGLAAPLKSAEENSDRIKVSEQGVVVEDQWFNVSYPLTLVLEGALQEKIATPGGREVAIPELQLGTSDSVWVSLGAVLGAIFSIGLGAGFLKDSAGVLE